MTVGLDAGQESPEVTVNQMVMGYAQKSVAGSSNVTLNDYETTWAMLEFTGALTGSIDVLMSEDVAKLYLLYNNTSGAFTLTFKTNTGTGIEITQGSEAIVYSDGTNIALFSLNGTSYLELAGGTITGAMIINAALTMGGSILMADNLLSRPELKDYSETTVSIAASAIDISLGNYQYKTISGATTFTITNPSPTTKACGFTLELTNAGTNITWPASVKWPGGVAPTLTAAGVDLLTFTTRDEGTTWYGALAMEDMQ